MFASGRKPREPGGCDAPKRAQGTRLQDSKEQPIGTYEPTDNRLARTWLAAMFSSSAKTITTQFRRHPEISIVSASIGDCMPPTACLSDCRSNIYTCSEFNYWKMTLQCLELFMMSSCIIAPWRGSVLPSDNFFCKMATNRVRAKPGPGRSCI